MSNRYTIEIIADAPPRLCLGDKLAGGQIVGINCANDEPDIVSAAWLADKLTLSKSTIVNRCININFVCVAWVVSCVKNLGVIVA